LEPCIGKVKPRGSRTLRRASRHARCRTLKERGHDTHGRRNSHCGSVGRLRRVAA
jgi:hypothetical protein